MKTSVAINGFALSLMLFSIMARGSENCSSSYYQGCKSCEDLRRVAAKAKPNDGDYYRGAQWNGLYAAYVLNCTDVAKDLLKRGAAPDWGGSQGSMILSVSNKWPHNNENVNRGWAALLFDYGADARKIVPDQNENPEQTASHDVFSPDYPALFRMFLR